MLLYVSSQPQQPQLKNRRPANHEPSASQLHCSIGVLWTHWINERQLGTKRKPRQLPLGRLKVHLHKVSNMLYKHVHSLKNIVPPFLFSLLRSQLEPVERRRSKHQVRAGLHDCPCDFCQPLYPGQLFSEVSLLFVRMKYHKIPSTRWKNTVQDIFPSSIVSSRLRWMYGHKQVEERPTVNVKWCSMSNGINRRQM